MNCQPLASETNSLVGAKKTMRCIKEVIYAASLPDIAIKTKLSNVKLGTNTANQSV